MHTPPEPQPNAGQSPSAAIETAVLNGDRHGRQPAEASPWSAALNALLLCAFILIAGLTPSAAKLALAELPPLTAGFIRFAVASVLLIATWKLFTSRDERSRRPIERRDYPAIIAAALLCVPINQATYLTGVKLAGAAHAGLFYALNPVLIYLITLIIGWGRPSRRDAVAAILAFAGAGLIAWESFHLSASPRAFQGDLLLFCAVVTWALFTLAVTPLSNKYGPVRTITVVMSVGSLLYAPACLIDGSQLRVSELTSAALFGFAFITLLTSYLNYILWAVILTRIDVNRVSVSVNAAPLVAVIAAHYWSEEPLTRWLIIGAALILTAISLANWSRIKRLLPR